MIEATDRYDVIRFTDDGDDVKWKKYRMSGIGGSDVSAVVGVNPWKSRFDVYSDKIEGTEIEQTDRMLLGSLIEPSLVNYYKIKTGHEVWYPKEKTVLELKSNTIAMVTPDFIARHDGEKILGEIKFVSSRLAHHWGVPGSDAVPDYVLTQVMWGMGITGIQKGVVVAMIGGDDIRVYDIDFDQELFNMLLQKCTEFWESHVVPKQAPEIDGSEGAKKWLEKHYPENTDIGMLDTTPEITGLAKRLHKVRFDQSQLETERKEIENKIKGFIGEKQGVIGPWGKITWKTSKGSEKVNYEEICKDLVRHDYIPGVEMEKMKKRFVKVTKGARRFVPKFAEVK